MNLRSRSAGCRTTWPWGSALKSWKKLSLNAEFWWRTWATCKSCSYASKDAALSVFHDQAVKNSRSLSHIRDVTLSRFVMFVISDLISFCGFPENGVTQNASWRTWKRTAVLQWAVRKALRRRYCTTGDTRGCIYTLHVRSSESFLEK